MKPLHKIAFPRGWPLPAYLKCPANAYPDWTKKRPTFCKKGYHDKYNKCARIAGEPCQHTITLAARGSLRCVKFWPERRNRP